MKSLSKSVPAPKLAAPVAKTKKKVLVLECPFIAKPDIGLQLSYIRAEEQDPEFDLKNMVEQEKKKHGKKHTKDGKRKEKVYDPSGNMGLTPEQQKQIVELRHGSPPDFTQPPLMKQNEIARIVNTNQNTVSRFLKFYFIANNIHWKHLGGGLYQVGETFFRTDRGNNGSEPKADADRASNIISHKQRDKTSLPSHANLGQGWKVREGFKRSIESYLRSLKNLQVMTAEQQRLTSEPNLSKVCGSLEKDLPFRTHRIEKNNNNGDRKQARFEIRKYMINERIRSNQQEKGYKNFLAIKELIKKGELTSEALKNNRYYLAEKKGQQVIVTGGEGAENKNHDAGRQ